MRVALMPYLLLDCIIQVDLMPQFCYIVSQKLI
jgi:hypothetical protein